MDLLDELKGWVEVFDLRAKRIKNGALPPEIHFSERLRNDLADAVKEITNLRIKVGQAELRYGNLLAKHSQK